MAKERCVRDTYRYGRLWKVGEVRTADQRDDEGNVVASEFFRLVEADEVVNKGDEYSKEELATKRREANQRDKRTAIVRAVEALDPSDDRHWTRDGYPSVSAVAANIDGFEVTRAMIHQACPAYDRDMAKRG